MLLQVYQTAVVAQPTDTQKIVQEDTSAQFVERQHNTTVSSEVVEDVLSQAGIAQDVPLGSTDFIREYVPVDVTFPELSADTIVISDSMPEHILETVERRFLEAATILPAPVFPEQTITEIVHDTHCRFFYHWLAVCVSAFLPVCPWVCLHVCLSVC